jgi:hypothetical protein
MSLAAIVEKHLAIDDAQKKKFGFGMVVRVTRIGTGP